MRTVGFVGWRGMVGTVLLQRMKEEKDFSVVQPVFYSTSKYNEFAPEIHGLQESKIRNALDIEDLAQMEVIISCQGSDYTRNIYPKLKSIGWQGYWVDAASALRMSKDAVIVLDPVNKNVIEKAIDNGIRVFVGGNCTVSLMLMAIGGLLKEKEVEWVNFATYQAVSGGGSAYMSKFLEEMQNLSNVIDGRLTQAISNNVLEIDKIVTDWLYGMAKGKLGFQAPLITNVLPWIGSEKMGEQSVEEWKGQAEISRLLNLETNLLAIDGVCVRVGSMRCHAQALTIKLRKDIPMKEIQAMIVNFHPWLKLVPNYECETLACLTPAAVSGKLDIAVGRMRKLNIGPEYFSMFTVGDQLLWGAAEPIRRVVRRLCGAEY